MGPLRERSGGECERLARAADIELSHGSWRGRSLFGIAASHPFKLGDRPRGPDLKYAVELIQWSYQRFYRFPHPLSGVVASGWIELAVRASISEPTFWVRAAVENSDVRGDIPIRRGFVAQRTRFKLFVELHLEEGEHLGPFGFRERWFSTAPFEWVRGKPPLEPTPEDVSCLVGRQRLFGGELLDPPPALIDREQEALVKPLRTTEIGRASCRE